jgi:hypothetical protein
MTLGDYRDIAAQLGGEKCKAVAFFDEKIKEQGRDEEVLADTSQMLALIGSMLDPPGKIWPHD